MRECDVLVLGGGPAGVTAAIYAARAGLKVILLYRDGGALAKAESIENYYGFPQPISGQALFEAGLAQAERLGIEIVQTQVLGLGFEMTGLTAETTDGVFSGKTLILSAGAQRRAPKLPGLQEFDGAGVSYCAVCDGFFCRGKEVAVLGAGEYALHEAGVLLPLASKVTLLTNGETAPENVPENLTVDTRTVAALEGEDGILRQVRFSDGTAQPVSRLFVALGTAGSGDLAKKLGLMTEGNKILVDEHMATNVPGLFAAGDCTGGLLQVAEAVAQGAKAGLSAVKYLRKQGGQP